MREHKKKREEPAPDDRDAEMSRLEREVELLTQANSRLREEIFRLKDELVKTGWLP